MSRANFAKFTADLNADEAFQSAFRDRFGGAGSQIPARELIAFASEHGYAFSLEDASSELTDAELADVAGGTTLDATTTTLDSTTLKLNEPSFTLLSSGYFIPGDHY